MLVRCGDTVWFGVVNCNLKMYFPVPCVWILSHLYRIIPKLNSLRFKKSFSFAAGTLGYVQSVIKYPSSGGRTSHLCCRAKGLSAIAGPSRTLPASAQQPPPCNMQGRSNTQRLTRPSLSLAALFPACFPAQNGCRHPLLPSLSPPFPGPAPGLPLAGDLSCCCSAVSHPRPLLLLPRPRGLAWGPGQTGPRAWLGRGPALVGPVRAYRRATRGPVSALAP